MSQQATLNLTELPLLIQGVLLSRYPHHRLPSGQKWKMDSCSPAAWKEIGWQLPPPQPSSTARYHLQRSVVCTPHHLNKTFQDFLAVYGENWIINTVNNSLLPVIIFQNSFCLWIFFFFFKVETHKSRDVASKICDSLQHIWWHLHETSDLNWIWHQRGNRLWEESIETSSHSDSLSAYMLIRWSAHRF